VLPRPRFSLRCASRKGKPIFYRTWRIGIARDTQSRARPQTLGISNQVSAFQATSPDRAARYSSSSPTVRPDSSNRVICSELTLPARPAQQFGDRALQRLFLRSGERLSWLWVKAAIRCGSVVIRYSTFCTMTVWVPCGHTVCETGVQDRRLVAAPICAIIHQSCDPGCDAAYLNL